MLYLLKNVSKQYKMGNTYINALNNVNLEIKEGLFYALVGPSGSGKSTLLHLLGTLDVPTTGEIVFGYTNLFELSENQKTDLRNESIGFIFQKYYLIPTLTAFENIELPMLQKKYIAKKKETIMDLLKAVGMEDYYNHKPNELSGGQQQRIAIARALVMNPKVVLADEPTANLDSHNSMEIIKLMKAMSKKYQTSFIFCTHDNLLSEECDCVIEIKDGRIII